MKNYPHIPVLLDEVINVFREVELKTYVDGTLGAAGHAEAILRSHPEIEHFIGIDQDKEALAIGEKRLNVKGVSLIKGNFSDLATHLKGELVDGILVDIGVSSLQLDHPERGFSFMRDGPLDMRMDQAGGLTAADIVNTWEERDLAQLFFRYGEEKQSRRIARGICAARPFDTTLQLAECIEKNASRTRWDIHPATKTFQALRIAVNRELERLELFLPQAVQSLKKGGRLAIITFHSLEDRIVKQKFAYYASDKESTTGIGGMFLSKEPQVKLVTRKPIEASIEEIKKNPRSRSAKLRVIEKL